jgi:hypothetical protein
MTTIELIVTAVAIQGVAVFTTASACMWNLRRLAEISRAVTRIENDLGSDVGRQSNVWEVASAPDLTVHPAPAE